MLRCLLRIHLTLIVQDMFLDKCVIDWAGVASNLHTFPFIFSNALTRGDQLSPVPRNADSRHNLRANSRVRIRLQHQTLYNLYSPT
jgi:hypothetical protein